MRYHPYFDANGLPAAAHDEPTTGCDGCDLKLAKPKNDGIHRYSDGRPYGVCERHEDPPEACYMTARKDAQR
jgi:hypothetical protein